MGDQPLTWKQIETAKVLLASHDRLLRGLVVHRDAFAAANSVEDPETASQLADFDADIRWARGSQSRFVDIWGIEPGGGVLGAF